MAARSDGPPSPFEARRKRGSHLRVTARIFPLTFLMNPANPASCSLIMSRVVWSVSSSVAASNFCGAKVTITSGRPKISASIETRHWRR